MIEARTADLTGLKDNSVEVTNEETFANHLDRIDGVPAWLLDLKRESWKDFVTAHMPKRTEDAWRFSNTESLNLDNYHQVSDINSSEEESLKEQSDQLNSISGKITFADDHQCGGVEFSAELKEKGVIWTTLEDAFFNHSDIVKKYFTGKLPNLGAEKFGSLHHALSANGTFLYIPRGVEIEFPFATYNWTSTQDMAVFPHTIIIAEDNAKVSFVNFFKSMKPDTRNLAISCSNIYAGNGSQISYAAVQDWNLKTQSYHLNTANANRDANIKSININVGSAYMRHEHHTRMLGSGSKVDTYSLSATSGEQEFDQRSLQTHSAPHTVSDLLFKNTLLDHSRTIFSGLIRVDENAQKTDAYQTNRNLLLSDVAEANSLPGLEILADDVKCSHGATTGRLDQNQLFYMLSRGIPKRTAQQLMVFGFFEEIIDKFDNQELANNVRGIIRSKLHK
jgi:Fe-S cluster assembly protein SufD